MTDPLERLVVAVATLAIESAVMEAELKAYRTAIAFETTCLHCASLTERLAYAESIIAELKQPTKEN